MIRITIFQYVYFIGRNLKNKLNRFSSFFIIFLIFISLLTSCSLWNSDNTESHKVIAYISGRKNVQTMGLKATSLTHINYAFAKIKDGKPYLSNERDQENLYYLVSLKSVNPQLKVLLSVGGWGGSKYFSDVASTDSSRKIFVINLVILVAMYNLDGVDIDWEYPGQEGANNHYRPEDKWNYSLLLEDLRVALNRMSFMQNGNQKYLLTIAAGADQTWLDHVVIDDIVNIVDYINLMTYDYHGEWENHTGHLTNLYVPACALYGNSINQSVKLFEKAGVPARKLVIGGAFYGRWWRGVKKENNGLCQDATGPGGSWDYVIIADSVMKISGYKKYRDKKAKAPYLWNETEGVFVTYDDPLSLAEKVKYVQKKHLAGIMFWEYSGDDKGVLLNAILDAFR